MDRHGARIRQAAAYRSMFSRRHFASGVAAGMLAPLAKTHRGTAQGAGTPSSASLESGFRPMTREEYYASLREAFPFEEPESTGGELVFVASTDISTLNPFLVSDGPSGLIAGYLYDWLVTVSPIDAQLVPNLADTWEVADDGLTYTFSLNPGARWHDGEALTVDDVIFSFDAMMDQQNLSIGYHGLVEVLASHRKIDDTTIELVARDQRATFVLDTAGSVPILPRHIWEGIPLEEWGSVPATTGEDPSQVIGSGPFRFVEWVFNDHVTLARNDDYWDVAGRPVIDEFIRQVVVDPVSRVQALITGEADISQVAPSEVSSLRESHPELNIVSFDTYGFTFYLFNLHPDREMAAMDVRVRQALMYALDRDVAAEAIYEGLAVRADGTQPVLSRSHDPGRIDTIYTWQPDRGRQLLDAAGWTDTDGDGIREKDGKRFSFEMYYAEGSLTLYQLLPYLQQMWREVGVEMIPAAVPFPILLDAMDSGDFDALLLAFSWDITGDQGVMYRCDAVPPAGFNSMQYCNPRYDELDDLQRRELDPAKRIDMQIELSNIVNNDQANSVLFFSKTTMGSQPRVHNYFPNGNGEFWSLPFLWVE